MRLERHGLILEKEKVGQPEAIRLPAAINAIPGKKRDFTQAATKKDSLFVFVSRFYLVHYNGR
jgi:hypothetical protein